MFGSKKPSPILDKAHLRQQQKQTDALNKQNRLLEKQTRLMKQNAKAAGQGGAGTHGLLSDFGKMAGAITGAIGETIGELREDIRTHTALTEAHKQQHARSQLGHKGMEINPEDIIEEGDYVPPSTPPNPLFSSSIWGRLTTPGKPLVRLDGYFHTTSEEDLANYIKALKSEVRPPYTATMVAINPATPVSTPHLESFSRALAENSQFYGIIGFGPRNIIKNQEDIDGFLTQIINDNTKIFALGPIGLDKSYAPHTLPQQVEQLHLQLAIAADFELPTFIMNINATKELDEALANAPQKPPELVYTKPLHTEDEVNMVLAHNMHVLIRAEFTWPEEEKYRENILTRIPRNRWLLASGNGLLAGEGRRGQMNTPQTLSEILKTLNQLTNHDPDDLLTQLASNAQNLFVR